MNTRKYSRTITLLICAILLVISFSVTTNADMGPKPSVNIIFENMGDELCYGTLLSEKKSTGPASAWEGDDESTGQYGNDDNAWYLNYETWKAFVTYEDSDGFYFLQWGWQVNETKELVWGYYPPSPFKILLYYPETETFLVSEICKRYAFDSYYTVDMDGMSIASVEYNEELSNNERIQVQESYNYSKEGIAFGARIIVTIVIEIGIALLFGFRKPKQLLILVLTNIFTQFTLNILLNLISNDGIVSLIWEMYIICYAYLEFMVFLVEAVLYCTVLKKVSEHPKRNRYYVLYALVANVASFGVGLILTEIFPILNNIMI